MKKFLRIIFTLLLFISSAANAQLQKVIVENYYVSDANDATDTIGGILEEGSKTYRIYVQLAPGSKLRKIYGDANHALKISSTADFFNNIADGQSFGKDFTKNRLEENTVALDSWLTLGQVSRISSKTYFGVLKNQDRDGSFIGGINNDGGSAMIASGLLNNYDVNAGLPLTASDGNDTMTTVPSSWADYGFIDLISGVDSTIFGSAKTASEFISYNAGLQNSGVSGVSADSNQILVAQLTTKGEISFELNIEVEEPDGINMKIVKYVANNDTLLQDEKFNAYLKFPLSCGCKDPDFVEYNSRFTCDNSDSCKTRIVFGCTDPAACNYDADANFNLPQICCYPGFCNDRDLSVVCPDLNTERNRSLIKNIYPNPATDKITVELNNEALQGTKFIIYNSYGETVLEKGIGFVKDELIEGINISQLQKGFFLLRVISGTSSEVRSFVKN